MESHWLLSRWTLAILVSCVALVGPSSASPDSKPTTQPVVVSAWRGWVLAVSQRSDLLAWCRQPALFSTVLGAEIFTRRPAGGRVNGLRANCAGADIDIVLPAAGVVWGGWVDVRCADMNGGVWTLVRGHTFSLDGYQGDCNGHGADFRGLVTDGSSAYYAMLEIGGAGDCLYSPDPCTYFVKRGMLYRVQGTKAMPVRNVPATVLIAASPGRIATIRPEQKPTAADDRAELPFPRAATNAPVEIRRADTGAVMVRFAPRGIVVAVAIDGNDAVVLVDQDGKLRVEWYDERNGRRAGAISVPASSSPRLSVSEGKAVLAVGKTLRLLNLRTGTQQTIWRGDGEPVDPSIVGSRIVWGENNRGRASVLVRVMR